MYEKKIGKGEILKNKKSFKKTKNKIISIFKQIGIIEKISEYENLKKRKLNFENYKNLLIDFGLIKIYSKNDKNIKKIFNEIYDKKNYVNLKNIYLLIIFIFMNYSENKEKAKKFIFKKKIQNFIFYQRKLKLNKIEFRDLSLLKKLFQNYKIKNSKIFKFQYPFENKENQKNLFFKENNISKQLLLVSIKFKDNITEKIFLNDLNDIPDIVFNYKEKYNLSNKKEMKLKKFLIKEYKTLSN